MMNNAIEHGSRILLCVAASVICELGCTTWKYALKVLSIRTASCGSWLLQGNLPEVLPCHRRPLLRACSSPAAVCAAAAAGLRHRQATHTVSLQH